ncbi:hypothetical protein QFC22_003546 [Naganishia vaughanmartiniae]|uniref:Uncharacterized protein n=1 Tax=Naganishia vaughanmartiniae TaxID=1424756 RepID=A0ACC2X6P2_9TREE|nr:hypothetical protein QFC22_003546 [Naganishia vaughanmartiniae]
MVAQISGIMGGPVHVDSNSRRDERASAGDVLFDETHRRPLCVVVVFEVQPAVAVKPPLVALPYFPKKHRGPPARSGLDLSVDDKLSPDETAVLPVNGRISAAGCGNVTGDASTVCA